MNQNIRFFIRKPTLKPGEKGSRGSRTGFSIYKRIQNEDGTTKNETIIREDIEAINQSYNESKITFEEAHANIKKVHKVLLKSIGIEERPDVYNNQNQRLLEKYWVKEYEDGDRNIQDPASAKSKLQRAILAMGNVSLISASKQEILKQLESHKFPRNKERELTDKLNALLKFTGRNIKIKKKQEERLRVKYLNEEEILLISQNINDEVLGCMVMLAFYSGLRQGELFALKPENLKGNSLDVVTQIDKNEIERDPKWGSTRLAYIFSEGIPYFKKWLILKDDFQYSRSAISKRFKATCKKLFKDKNKWCKFHDTRHSYAINLLRHDVSLSQISQSLGNSIVVCQKYYAGFSLTNETIDSINLKIEKFKKD